MRVHFGTLLLSAGIAMTLWLMAHGTSSVDRGVDIPVLFDDVPDDLVIVGQSVDKVNLRVLGSRAALRNVTSDRLEYRIDVSGAKPGHAVYEVDTSRIELPRRVRAISRSPAAIEVDFERRGRKAVDVRADIEGEVATGFRVGAIEVDPPRIWLAGARGEVMRVAEVATEPIDLTGLQGPVERRVRLVVAEEHVWPEQDDAVDVRIAIEPQPAPADENPATPVAPSARAVRSR